MNHASRFVVVVWVLGTAVASAQSLDDVARQEQARRKAVQGAAKVYTNDNLHAEPPPSTPPGSDNQPRQPAAPAADSATASGAQKATDDGKKAADNGKKPA